MCLHLFDFFTGSNVVGMRKEKRRERENRERNVIEPGDVEEGLRAALAIGNDQLQNMLRRLRAART